MLYKPSELHPNFEEVLLTYDDESKYWKLDKNIEFEFQVNTNGSKVRSYKIDILRGENDNEDPDNNLLGSIYGCFMNDENEAIALSQHDIAHITITPEQLSDAGVLIESLDAEVNWRWRIRLYEDILQNPPVPDPNIPNPEMDLKSLFGQSYVGEGYLVGTTRNVVWLNEVNDDVVEKSFVQQVMYSTSAQNDFKPFKTNKTQGILPSGAIAGRSFYSVPIDINDILPKYRERLADGHMYIVLLPDDRLQDQKLLGPCLIESTSYNYDLQRTVLHWSEEQGGLYDDSYVDIGGYSYELIYRERSEVDAVVKSVGFHQLTKLELKDAMSYNQAHNEPIYTGLQSDQFARNRVYIHPVPEFDDKTNGLAFLCLKTQMTEDSRHIESGIGKMQPKGDGYANDGYFVVNDTNVWNNRLFFKYDSTTEEYVPLFAKPNDWDVGYIQMPSLPYVPNFQDFEPVYKYWGGNSYVRLDNEPSDWTSSYTNYYIIDPNSGAYNTYYYNVHYSNRNEPKLSAFSLTTYTPNDGTSTYYNQRYCRKIINYVGTTGECTLFSDFDFMPDVRYSYEIYIQDKSTATWDNPIYIKIDGTGAYCLGGAQYAFDDADTRFFNQIVSNVTMTRQNPKSTVEWGDGTYGTLEDRPLTHYYTPNMSGAGYDYCEYTITIYDNISNNGQKVLNGSLGPDILQALSYPIASQVVAPQGGLIKTDAFVWSSGDSYMELYLPREITLKNNIFRDLADNATNLNVYFEGDETEWELIKENQTVLQRATVHYNASLPDFVPTTQDWPSCLFISWSDSISPTGYLTIGPLDYDVATAASYTLFIQPNNAITSDEYKPVFLQLYQSNINLKAGGYVTNIVYNTTDATPSYPQQRYLEYDKNVTLDLLDGSQWMINFQAQKTLGSQGELLFPQTPYKIYSNFVDSIPECMMYLRPTKTASFTFQDAFNHTSYTPSEQTVECACRDVEISAIVTDMDKTEYPWNTVNNKSYHYIIERWCDGEHITDDDLIQEKQYDDKFTVTYRGLETTRGASHQNVYRLVLYVEDNMGHEWKFPENGYISLYATYRYLELPLNVVYNACYHRMDITLTNASYVRDIQSVVLYRQQQNETAWHYLGHLQVDALGDTTIFDYNIRAGYAYRYSMVVNPEVMGQQRITEYTNDAFVRVECDNWSLTDCRYDTVNGLYKIENGAPQFVFYANITIEEMSDNLNIIKYETLGRFNKLIQTQQKFASGSISALLNDIECKQQVPNNVTHIVDLTQMQPQPLLQAFIERHQLSDANFAELLHEFLTAKYDSEVGGDGYGFVEDDRVRVDLNEMSDLDIIEEQSTWAYLYRAPNSQIAIYCVYSGTEFLGDTDSGEIQQEVPKMAALPINYTIVNDADKVDRWHDFVSNGSLKLLKYPDGQTRIVTIASATTTNVDYRSDQYPTTIGCNWQEVADTKYASIVGWKYNG